MTPRRLQRSLGRPYMSRAAQYASDRLSAYDSFGFAAQASLLNAGDFLCCLVSCLQSGVAASHANATQAELVLVTRFSSRSTPPWRSF